MRKYTIQKKEFKAPINWEAIPLAPIDSIRWDSHSIPLTATAQLCYDDSSLYVRLSTTEESIRATITTLNDEVYEDSCLEFFFQPIISDPRYLNFELNPLGALLVGLGADRHSRVRLNVPHFQEFFCIHPIRREKDWEVRFAIPFDFVRDYFPAFRTDALCMGNFYKCGEKTVKAHYITWNLIDLPQPDFHQSPFFGKLTFAK